MSASRAAYNQQQLEMTRPTINAKATKDIADVWDVAVPVLWDGESLAAGIIETLDLRRPGLRVLDASCGHGMPGVFMNRVGVPVAMSNGSPAMVQCTRDACAAALGPDHEVDVRVSYWKDLPAVWGEASFDVILVRGNSLPYVLNWDSGCGGEKPSEEKLRAGYATLVESMRAIKRTLRPGGVFYVDCGKNCQSADDQYVLEKDIALKHGKSVHLHWDIAAYPEESICRWENCMKFSNAVGSIHRVLETTFISMLCGCDQLRTMLNHADLTGFKNMHPRGEDVYMSFLAYHDDDAAVAARKDAAVKAVWNVDGFASYGLFENVAPCPFASAAVEAPREARGKSEGVLAGPNRVLREWQASLVAAARGGRPVTSVVDLTCGSGQSTVQLSKQYHASAGYVLGVDACSQNVAAARLAALGADAEVAVDFNEVSADADALPDDRVFSLAVSHCGLSLLSAEARRAALSAAYASLEDGGVLQLDDRVAGSETLSARVHLHYFERLGMRDAWSVEEYVQELHAIGFKIKQTVDLSAHQVASYKAATTRAGSVAEQTREDPPLYTKLRAMEHDYKVSAAGGAAGETGWVQFVCVK